MWWNSKKVATTPAEQVLARFVALVDFHCEELRSSYVTGQVYFLREGNTKLEVTMREWLASGKIKLLED